MLAGMRISADAGHRVMLQTSALGPLPSSSLHPTEREVAVALGAQQTAVHLANPNALCPARNPSTNELAVTAFKVRACSSAWCIAHL